MNGQSRSILHRIELRRRSERGQLRYAIQYEQPCSMRVYSGSLAQACGLRSAQILAKVNCYNVLVLEVFDPDDEVHDDDVADRDDDDSIERKENLSFSSPCRITSNISVNDALRGRVLRENNAYAAAATTATMKYTMKHDY